MAARKSAGPRKPVAARKAPKTPSRPPKVKPVRAPKSVVYKIKKAPKFRPGRIV